MWVFGHQNCNYLLVNILMCYWTRLIPQSCTDTLELGNWLGNTKTPQMTVQILRFPHRLSTENLSDLFCKIIKQILFINVLLKNHVLLIKLDNKNMRKKGGKKLTFLDSFIQPSLWSLKISQNEMSILKQKKYDNSLSKQIFWPCN